MDEEIVGVSLIDKIFEIRDLRVKSISTGSNINRGNKSSSYCTCCRGTLSLESSLAEKHIRQDVPVLQTRAFVQTSNPSSNISHVLGPLLLKVVPRSF